MIQKHEIENDYLYIVCVEINPYAEEFDFYFVMKSNYDIPICRPLTRQNRILVADSEEVDYLLSLCDEDVGALYKPPLHQIECSISHLIAVINGANPDYKILSLTLNFILDSLSLVEINQPKYIRDISDLADNASIDFDIDKILTDEARKEEVATAIFWAWGVICASVWKIDNF